MVFEVKVTCKHIYARFIWLFLGLWAIKKKELRFTLVTIGASISIFWNSTVLAAASDTNCSTKLSASAFAKVDCNSSGDSTSS